MSTTTCPLTFVYMNKKTRTLTQQHHQFSSHSCKQDLLAVCPMLLSDHNIKQKI